MTNEEVVNTGKETEASGNEAEVSGKRSSTLSKVLPTGRLTFQKQVEIIRAYGAAYDAQKAAVGIESIASFVQMAASTVSQSNAFLTEVGLVRKDGRRFIPASEVVGMHRVFELNKEKAYAKLAPLFEKTWFGQLVMPKLKFRPTPEDDIVHELFEAATAETLHLPQIRMLIDYLVLVGLVERDGMTLRVKNGCGEDNHAPAPAPVAQVTPTAEVTPVAPSNEPPASVLLLNADGSRRVTVKAPPTIKRQELERIKKWLEFQLIVEEEEPAK